MIIESLTKVPFTVLFALSTHISANCFTPATPREQRLMADDKILEMHWVAAIIRYVSWVHAAVELAVVLASAAPKSTVAQHVLIFLLPNKDPGRIFLSPMGFLGAVLMVMGTVIRVQCYRKMGKQFTSSVTLLKDHKLITSGPYSYVRHPSYTGGLLILTALVIWYAAEGSWLREREVHKMPLAWLILAPVIAIISFLHLLVFRRIPAEDEILRKAFGKEWDEWARKVPDRIIPGIY